MDTSLLSKIKKKSKKFFSVLIIINGTSQLPISLIHLPGNALLAPAKQPPNRAKRSFDIRLNRNYFTDQSYSHCYMGVKQLSV